MQFPEWWLDTFSWKQDFFFFFFTWYSKSVPNTGLVVCLICYLFSHWHICLDTVTPNVQMVGKEFHSVLFRQSKGDTFSDSLDSTV